VRTGPQRTFQEILTSDFTAILHDEILETFGVLEHLDVTWKERSGKLL
jgi:hypothetical protein